MSQISHNITFVLPLPTSKSKSIVRGKNNYISKLEEENFKKVIKIFQVLISFLFFLTHFIPILKNQILVFLGDKQLNK